MERLDDLVEHGSKKVQSVVFDITKLDSIPVFVNHLNSDLDLVFLNSGVQFGHNFSKPEGVNRNIVRDQLTTNYLAHVHIVRPIEVKLVD